MLQKPSRGHSSVTQRSGWVGVSFPGKKCYEGVRFNVISITRGWVGVIIAGKKRHATLEWLLNVEQKKCYNVHWLKIQHYVDYVMIISNPKTVCYAASHVPVHSPWPCISGRQTVGRGEREERQTERCVCGRGQSPWLPWSLLHKGEGGHCTAWVGLIWGRCTTHCLGRCTTHCLGRSYMG